MKLSPDTDRLPPISASSNDEIELPNAADVTTERDAPAVTDPAETESDDPTASERLIEQPLLKELPVTELAEASNPPLADNESPNDANAPTERKSPIFARPSTDRSNVTEALEAVEIALPKYPKLPTETVEPKET